MAEAIKILPHYTYEDYVQWEGRWELIEGIPYAMSPAPTPKHQWICINIASELRNSIKKAARKDCKVYSFLDYKIKGDTIFQPDVLIVCKPITKKFLDFAPSLVIEILSPATALKDRNTKFHFYQQQKVKYYLLVDTDKETVEVYQLDKDGTYQLQQAKSPGKFIFNLDENCSLRSNLNEIWK